MILQTYSTKYSYHVHRNKNSYYQITINKDIAMLKQKNNDVNITKHVVKITVLFEIGKKV